MAKIKILAGDCPEGEYMIYWQIENYKFLGNNIPRFNEEKISFITHMDNVPMLLRPKSASTEHVPRIPEDCKIYLTPLYVSSIEQLTEENKKSLLATAGWGTAGAIALGPLGAVGGMLFGSSNKQLVTFICNLEDGHKFMGQTPLKEYNKLNAALFEKKPAQIEETKVLQEDDSKVCPYCAETIKKAAIFCRFCKHDLPSD